MWTADSIQSEDDGSVKCVIHVIVLWQWPRGLWQENCIHKLLFPLGRKRDMDSSITAKHLQIVMIWLIICIGGQEFLNLIGHFNIIS